MTRLTVLGSGTLVPDDDRRSAAHLVEVDDARVLLDCGFGTVHGFDRHRVSWPDLTHVAVTHFHADHVGDVAPLLFTLRHGLRPPREEGLTLLGPRGLGAFLDGLASAFGPWVLDPGFPLRVVELPPEGGWEDPEGRFRLLSHPTPHTDASVAYRFETGDGVVAYTGDTGPDVAVAGFLSGADVLVSECSLPDPPEMDTHLSPRTVAELARIATPRLLLVTHVYPFLEPEEVPDLIRTAGWKGRVEMAWDGTRVDLPADGDPEPVHRR